MNCISNFAGLRILCVVGLSAIVLSNSANGAANENIRSVTPGNSRWALIVHTGPEGTAEARSLANTLKESYGFHPDNAIELYDNDATRDRIFESMVRIYEEIRPNDVLFVHLSMAVLRNDYRTALLSADYEIDSPWTSLEVSLLVDWLVQLPDVSVLVTYPSCSRNVRNSEEDYLLNEIRAAKRRNTIDILTICDLESMHFAEIHEEFASTAAAQRRGMLSQEMLRILQDAAQDYFGWISSEQLTSELDKSLELHDIELVHGSTFQYSTFAFTPWSSEIDRYKDEYRRASTRVIREQALYSLINFAYDRLDSHLYAAGFLRDIAIDPQAGTSDQEISARDALRLRWLAVDLLNDLKSDESTNALIGIISAAKDEASVRRRALSHVVPRVDVSVSDMDFLLQALDDSDSTVRSQAIAATGYLSYAPAAPAVWNAVEEDPNLQVRSDALQTIAQLGGREYVESITNLVVDVGQPTELRVTAIYVLADIGLVPEAASALVDLLKRDELSEVRAAAAFALPSASNEISRKRVYSALVGATKDRDQSVREAAARSLGRIGNPRADRSLRRLLVDERNSPAVRAAAAESLGQIGATRYAGDLRIVAANVDEPAAVRAAAMSALAQMEDPEGVPILLAAVTDRDPDIQRFAKEALERLDIDNSQFTTRGGSSAPWQLRAELARLMGKRRNSADVPALIEYLGDENHTVRAEAIDALSAFPGEETTAQLLVAVRESTNPATRAGAAIVLGNTKNPDGLSELRSAVNDPYSAVSIAAVRSLGQFEDPAALQTVLNASTSDRTSVRLAAVETLGYMQYYDADTVAPALIRIAREDKSSEVRAAAVRALGAAPPVIGVSKK